MTTIAAGQTPTVVSPAIVAKGKLLKQTNTIPTTTLYTPKQTGLFRLSIYGVLLTGNGYGGTWFVNVGWTDDFGPEAVNSLIGGTVFYYGQFDQLNLLPAGSPLGGPVLTFEAIVGQPITYSVTSNVNMGGSSYSIYYVLERLE